MRVNIMHYRYMETIDGKDRVTCSCGWQSKLIDDSKMFNGDYYGILMANADYFEHLKKPHTEQQIGIIMHCPRCAYSWQDDTMSNTRQAITLHNTNLLDAKIAELQAEVTKLKNRVMAIELVTGAISG